MHDSTLKIQSSKLRRPLLALALASTFVAAGCANNGPAVVGRETAQWPASWAHPAESVPVAVGRQGMVSSTDSVASAVGAAVMARGGTAVDAAIATFFALGVVNPEAGNLGGGGFAVLRMNDGRVAGLDFREKAPLAATREMYLDARGEATNASRSGALSSGVPGSVAGMWSLHQRFGTLPWADLLAPAITLADGLVVHERLGRSLAEYEDRLRRHRATAEALLIDGRAPRIGQTLSQEDLAGTLRRIAAEGMDGFYRGRTAELFEAEMEREGGIINREDLAAYQAVWRDPVHFDYRGHSVISMYPPSSGGATIGELLNILEGFDLGALEYHSAEHVHLFAEAAKRAYADRNSYLADPDFVTQPVERMVSQVYADERREGISLSRATPAADVEPGLGPVPGLALAAEGVHTTHFSVVDGAGNAVAVTTTLNSLYGNGITVTGAGFLLNNEMDDFAIEPGAPNMYGLVQGEANAIEPGKRMLSAMTPTLVLDPEGDLRLVTGSPGGSTIITTVAQIISNVVDFDMDAAAAVAAPRVHHQHLPDVVMFEVNGLTDDVVSALRSMGHDVEERGGHSGDATTILIENGLMYGAPDPRRGGRAAAVR